jgi:AraC-like DNA-binding protein/quercetin dioxygenase-like cupin family protein
MGVKMNTYMYEAIEHDKNFPAKVFTTSIDKSTYHWHYDYEIMLVLKGSVCLSIWPETYIVNQGNIVLVNSKVVHGLQKTNQDNICLFIQLNKALFENWQDKNQVYRFYLNSVKEKLKPKAPYCKFINTVARIGLESDGKSIANLYRMQALLYALVADLFEYVHYDIRQYANKSVLEEESDVLLKIIEYVEQHYLEDNITERLCHYIGMSEKTLYRFLKSHTNLTLKELIVNTKLERAQYLLTTTDKPISVIACESGFGNCKTFYRIYKKETGMTPTEYKQNGRPIEKNKKIQGYLDFNKREAIQLLKYYT